MSTSKKLGYLSSLIVQRPPFQQLRQDRSIDNGGPIIRQQQNISPSQVSLLHWRWSTPAAYWLVIGTMFLSKGEVSFRQEQKAHRLNSLRMWKLSFNPARWLPLGCWQQTLRFYRTVDAESEILKACFNRDVALVRRLFIDGIASPFDRHPDGTTLLHVNFLEGYGFGSTD